jgi:hypothetical protein
LSFQKSSPFCYYFIVQLIFCERHRANYTKHEKGKHFLQTLIEQGEDTQLDFKFEILIRQKFSDCVRLLQTLIIESFLYM